MIGKRGIGRIARIGIIVVVVIIVLIGVGALVSLSGTKTTPSSSSSSNPLIVSSGTLTVTCTSCNSGNPNSYQFSGSIDNAGTSNSYDGNVTQTYTVQRQDMTSYWIVSWDFQKSTTDGSMEVKFVLGNGTTVFDQTTTASYGVVSGSFSSYPN